MTTPWSNRVGELDTLWSKPGCKHYRKKQRDKIVQLMKGGGEMLDVGCGSGVLYSYLPPEVQKVYTGVDFTPEFIQLCQEKYPEAQWKIEDARKLSFPDNSYFLVNTSTVLQHIKEWQQAAREMVRVARRYVVSTCRTWYAPTKVVGKTKGGAIRRRFNVKTIPNFYQRYGHVEWEWSRWTDGKRLLAIYVVTLQR